MNWRERMRVDPSNAEEQVYEELQRQGMYEYERDWVLLIMDNGVQAARKDHVTKQMVEGCVQFTLPDWCAVEKKKPVYLDGCPEPKKGFLKLHLSPNTSARDDRINHLLTVNGWPPLRIPYNGRRLSHFKLFNIVDEIKEFLKVREVKGAPP